ncbi:MAG TPA: hypothetical protein VKV17_01640 [Bryobacteraceae bacterium]|nr:hypothetical protein [Bryobacteraceae bacterium]
MRRSQFPLFSIICLVFVGGAARASAQANNAQPAPKDLQDQIEVVGHISVPGPPVTSFVVTQHYGRNYLYAEHEGGKEINLIDITNGAQPLVLSNVFSQLGGGASLVAATGTAALTIEGSSSSSGASAPQTIRIMDLSDPQHPTVAREFTGVTAMTRDEQRGLIFLANGDGIWILRQGFPTIWTGPLVDAKCYGSLKNNTGPDLPYVDRDFTGMIRYCSPKVKTTAFAVVQSGDIPLRLDGPGNAQAAELVSNSGKKRSFIVSVMGEKVHETLKVTKLFLVDTGGTN